MLRIKIFICQGKHKIKNLQSELTDGLLLTEVIEAVTHQKVPDIQKKPKSRDIMITNIQASKSPLRNVIHPPNRVNAECAIMLANVGAEWIVDRLDIDYGRSY